MTVEPKNKCAILVVSFGSSYHETCKKNIGAIEQELLGAMEGWEVRRAFTSGMILKKLRNRDQLHIDNVAEAMERLIADGFDTVLVQPTHILNGEEYDDIVADVQPYKERFSHFHMGVPLLTASQDYQALCKIISKAFPAEENTALCLMGHGSSHFADSSYAALDYHFKDIGRNDIFVGTVEGFPDFDTLLRHLQGFGAKNILLTPFMVVAGDHAQNDMASDEEDSWKTLLESAGFSVRCLLKGLGEYPEIRKLYVEHAKAAL